jgi:predicted  nucleic acid-binding Zn-ribbon protein
LIYFFCYYILSLVCQLHITQKIENETKKQPPLYKPTEADKKRLPAAKIKQEVERTRRNFLKYKINLEKLEEQEKKLAEEIKGSENFDSLLDNLRKQREFVNDLMDPEEAVKILKANAEDLFNQRKNLLKSIDPKKQASYDSSGCSPQLPVIIEELAIIHPNL